MSELLPAVTGVQFEPAGQSGVDGSGTDGTNQIVISVASLKSLLAVQDSTVTTPKVLYHSFCSLYSGLYA